MYKTIVLDFYVLAKIVKKKKRMALNLLVLINIYFYFYLLDPKKRAPGTHPRAFALEQQRV